MTVPNAKTIFVPGAWMGGWIWEPTVNRLHDRGVAAETMTLRGLLPGEPEADIAAICLEDHIQQLVKHIESHDSRAFVLVSHSYSAMVTAAAADRLGGRVLGLIHVGGFVPTSGRSLMDDWGDSDDMRAQEESDIKAAGDLWLAPTREMLDHEPDLAASDRDFLAARFTPHPGRTVTDPVQLSTPVDVQPSTYVAVTPSGGFEDAWSNAPPAAAAASRWRRKHLVSGHWPMVSALDSTVDLLESEIGHYIPEGR